MEWFVVVASAFSTVNDRDLGTTEQPTRANLD